MSGIMTPIWECTQKFIKDDNGATAIEYGLISALIAVVIITAMMSVGTAQMAQYEQIRAAVDGAVNP